MMEPIGRPIPTPMGEHSPSRDTLCVAGRFSVVSPAIALPCTTGDPRVHRRSENSALRARIRSHPAVVIVHSPELRVANGGPAPNRRPVRAVTTVHSGVASAAVSFAAVIALGLGMPAYASATAATATATAVRAPVLQSFIVADFAPTVAVSRDAYGVTVPPPLQWPVDPTSRVSDGYGPRHSPCSGCSSHHEGVDYVAAMGTPVHAIAAGIVVETNNPGWASLGVHTAIQHVIDGQIVTSAYGHMQVASMPLQIGDIVFPGETIGRVGNTGASTGAHLHFEIRVGGTTPVDPLAWMHARLG